MDPHIHQTDPSRRLYEEIAAGTFLPPQRPPAALPPGRSADAGKHNLPAPRTSFVGRQREILEIKRSLAMTRLLTLTGAGGSGKTRLALEVARDLVGAYPDGVWLVELAGLSEGALVPQAVAKAVGAEEQPGRPLADTLAHYLRDKEMLLVVDNCEHLVEDAARLVDVLLDSCPRLRVLATSRESLCVAGEVRWTVPALSVPDPRRSPTVAELEGNESARLFVDRASMRRSGFALTAANCNTLAEICRRLDGMPLAIELAAARVGALSVEQVSQRLQDSLKLLTSGGRTETPRQRTLRGALNWSYELLAEREQMLFRRLSVFAGGWTLEAAEAVGAGEGVEEEDVADLLSGLVDKSLVVAEASTESGLRYRMLEPVRQYAWEKLKQSGEAEGVGRRHAKFFLALAEEVEPWLRGPEQRTRFTQLKEEHDNLRAALSWAIEQEEAALALQLGGALWRFWVRQGHWTEGRWWFQEGLETSGEVAPSVRAKALYGLGTLAKRQDDYDSAVTLYEASLALYREAGERRGIAMCLGELGAVMSYRGDTRQGAEMLEEALTQFRELRDKIEIACTLADLAGVAISTSNYTLASARLKEALELFREVGDSRSIAMCLGGLGWMAVRRGDHREATELLEEGLAQFREAGTPVEPDYLTNLGLTALLRGDYERAEELIEEGLVLGRELGAKVSIVESIEVEAMVAASRGKAGRAARLWGTAEASRETLGAPLPPELRTLYEPYTTVARAELGEEVLKAAWEEGRKMTPEEAVEYALSEEERATRAPERPSDDEPPPALTRREREVAAMVARGLSNRQIASEFHLSERTVESHVSKILRKLGLASRAEIAAWTTERRLLTPDPD
jgi:predicted ATPase/DNA-binding CsgD family transcriptional regulator